jgi:hypothetical protein
MFQKDNFQLREEVKHSKTPRYHTFSSLIKNTTLHLNDPRNGHSPFRNENPVKESDLGKQRTQSGWLYRLRLR